MQHTSVPKLRTSQQPKGFQRNDYVLRINDDYRNHLKKKTERRLWNGEGKANKLRYWNSDWLE